MVSRSRKLKVTIAKIQLRVEHLYDELKHIIPKVISKIKIVFGKIWFFVKYLSIGIIIGSGSMLIIYGLYYLIIELPQLQIPEQLREQTKLEDFKLLSDIENEFRKTIIQTLGGVVGLALLFLSWKRIRQQDKRIEQADEEIKVSKESQVTERFTRAIDQLGSEQLPTQMGALHALYRIAKESEKDRESICRILCQFVRGIAHKDIENDNSKLDARKLNVIEALKIIGTSSGIFSKYRKNLAGIKMPNTDFGGLNFSKTDFSNSILTVTSFRQAIVAQSRFQRSMLDGSNFVGSNLMGSDFKMSSAKCSHFVEADLTGASFRNAKLNDASFENSVIFETNFSNATWIDGRTCRPNLHQLPGRNDFVTIP